MSKKPVPYIPVESLQTQRVEIYINDLQKRLHQLRHKHETIFTECCDILKEIQEVSTQTITKEQEIGRIISEFEELGFRDNGRDIISKRALIQKVGDVKRLREKFEQISHDVNGHNEELDSELRSTIESFYSLTSESIENENDPEPMCLEVDDVAKALD